MLDKRHVYVVEKTFKTSSSLILFLTTDIQIASTATTIIKERGAKITYRNLLPEDNISSKLTMDIITQHDDFRLPSKNQILKEDVEQIKIAIEACDFYMFSPHKWCEKMTKKERKKSIALMQRRKAVEARDSSN